jgi:hypothetical protein
MDGKKYYLNDLVEGLLDRRLPFADELFPLLHMDPERANRIFLRILRKSLDNYEQSFPLVLGKDLHITNNNYTFIDNTSGVFSGNIDEDNIELVPTTVVKLSHGVAAMTSNYWRYEKPILYAPSGDILCRYFTNHPINVKIGPDKKFTEDSYIWGIQYPTIFENQFDFEMLKSIKSFSEQVQFSNIAVSYVNLDTTIQNLAEQVEQDTTSSSAPYEMWL